MADQESQIWPLAPAKLHQRSDEVTPTFKAIRRQRSNKCFVYIFTAIVLQTAVLLIFALVVLRVSFPGFELASVSVKTLNSTTSPSAAFNATVIAHLAVKNNNFGEYRFEGGVASLWSQGFKVGEAKTASGSAKARGTRKMNVTIEIKSSWLPQEARNNLTAEMNSGFLKIGSYAKLSGKVHLIKIMKKRKTIDMNCNMVLELKSRTIKDLKCN